MSDLIQYAPEATQISKDHGFGEEGLTRSRGEMVMLMVSELGECLEAHRKFKWASKNPAYSEFASDDFNGADENFIWNYLKERLKIFFTGKFYLSQLTFNQPLQTILPLIDNPVPEEFK